MIAVLTNVLGSGDVKARTVLMFGALGAVLSLLASACGARPQIVGTGSTKVVAAFYPLAYAAEQIGGGAVTVENLTPAGAEPHDLELTPGDVRDVENASLVLYLGSGFQPGVAKAVAGRKGRSLDLLSGLELRAAVGENGRPATDPHVWLDPVRYAAIARRIGAALGRRVATARFVGQVRALGAEYRRGLARCTRHEIVTSHAAFGYLAQRYGLRQVPLEGLAPEAEPTPGAVRRLVAEVKRTHATTVFFETLVSPKLAQAVAAEAGARTAVLNPLEGLTSAQIGNGATYFSVMRDNLDALRKGLGCR
jgi:zinc transport system substrate-binding protein